MGMHSRSTLATLVVTKKQSIPSTAMEGMDKTFTFEPMLEKKHCHVELRGLNWSEGSEGDPMMLKLGRDKNSSKVS